MQKEIKTIIEELRTRWSFILIEDCPEDCCELRTDFDDLKDCYHNLYYALSKIESIVKE